MHQRRGAVLAAVVMLASLTTVSAAQTRATGDVVCPRPPGSATLPRLAGHDRIGTAIAVALAAEEGRGDVRDLDEFVVVGSQAFPDAAVGAVLAAGRDVPLLLTPGHALDPRVADVLAALDTDNDGGIVHIIGGVDVVTEQVSTELRGRGFEVDRIADSTRYETADLVAERLADEDSVTGPVVVATGQDWPDASAGATLAAARLGQLRLVDGRGTPALEWAEDANVIILGGPEAVSPEIQSRLTDVATSVRRIAGEDRVATAALVAAELPDLPVISATVADWPDPVAAATLAARTGAAVVLVDAAGLPAASARLVAGRATSIVGGDAVVPMWLAADVADASVAPLGAPVVVSDDPTPCATMPGQVGAAVSFSLVTDATNLTFTHVAVRPDTASVTSGISAATVRGQPSTLEAFVSITPSETGIVEIEVELEATSMDGQTRSIRRGWTADVAAPSSSSRSGEGWLVAGGSSETVGTGGPAVTYTVEIADGIDVDQDLRQFADSVEATLGDTAHGWTSRGERRLQRVGDPANAAIRVLLASPSTVDRLCAAHGVNTAGIYSCWTGSVAALNSTRWFNGVSHVPDLALYRRYLVNHEVGHGFGRGHQACGGDGQVAPVMMQLTKSTYGCQPNALPYP